MKLSPLVYCLALFALSCQHKPTAEEILKQSIQAHGFDQKIDRLAYQKTTRLYYPDGALEKSIQQTHTLHWKPFQYLIEDENKRLLRKGDSIFNYVNGVRQTTEEDFREAKNALNAAYFVFWQPAKLLDKKAVLTYAGVKKLQNKIPVNVIKVDYPQSSSTDRWEFYFDLNNHLNIGYSVQHNGRWSLILNDDFHLEHQPILVKKRRSLFIDSLAQTSLLRAAYSYELLP